MEIKKNSPKLDGFNSARIIGRVPNFLRENILRWWFAAWEFS